MLNTPAIPYTPPQYRRRGDVVFWYTTDRARQDKYVDDHTTYLKRNTVTESLRKVVDMLSQAERIAETATDSPEKTARLEEARTSVQDARERLVASYGVEPWDNDAERDLARCALLSMLLRSIEMPGDGSKMVVHPWPAHDPAAQLEWLLSRGIAPAAWEDVLLALRTQAYSEVELGK